MKKEHHFELYHYCLMTNHVHLLMRFYDQEGLQKVMQRVNLTYANDFEDAIVIMAMSFKTDLKVLPLNKIPIC